MGRGGAGSRQNARHAPWRFRRGGISRPPPESEPVRASALQAQKLRIRGSGIFGGVRRRSTCGALQASCRGASPREEGPPPA